VASLNRSLQAVAAQAGVSPSTVSRALRNHSRISAPTIARVRTVAAELGYVPNPVIADLMRRIRRGGSRQILGTIAYLTFNVTEDAWRRSATYRSFYQGAEDRARELGFSVEPFWTRERGLNSKRLTHILVTRGIAGVIVGPRPVPPRIDILDWSKFAVASVGLPLPPELPFHQASSHHARLMEQLLAALRHRHYRRPGLVLVGAQMSKTDPGWPATWVYRQQELPADRRVPLFSPAGLEAESFARWYRRYRPDVIIGLQEVLDFAVRFGLRIPEQVAFAHLSRPAGPDGPAGMDQQGHKIGAGALDLVASQILSGERGIPETPRLLLTMARWVDGNTANAGGSGEPPLLPEIRLGRR